MASAYKRKSTWWIHFKDATGKRVARPTHAQSKTEARLLAESEERKARVLRNELGDAAAVELTVGELLEWYLQNYPSRSQRSQASRRATIQFHFLREPFATRKMSELRFGDVESFLQAKSKMLAPASVNHLRGYLSAAYNYAIRNGLWAGANPVSKVRKRKVPQRLGDYLRPSEIPQLLAYLDPRWRSFFAVAIYTGLRKGEIVGLLKSDVDLEQKRIYVRHSYDRDTTKGGRHDAIPIADDLVPFLRMAVESSPSEFVFPSPSGKMMSEEVKLHKVIKRAMARAGLVTGYRQKCRRKGCGYETKTSTNEVMRCPKCSMELWRTGVPRKFRFHDLRHTTASLLMMAGANPAAVQKILRHSDPRMTTEIYGHLAPDYLRDEVNRLHFAGVKEIAAASEASFQKVATNQLHGGVFERKNAFGSENFSSKSEGFLQSGRQDLNLRPLGPEGELRVVVGGVTECLSLEKSDVMSGGTVHPVAGFPPVFSQAATNQLHGNRVKSESEIREILKPFLSVDEVAKLVSVCRATVYRMVKAGELPHVKWGNSIRITEETVRKLMGQVVTDPTAVVEVSKRSA